MKKHSFIIGFLLFNAPVLLFICLINVPFFRDALFGTPKMQILGSLLIIFSTAAFFYVVLSKINTVLYSLEKELKLLSAGSINPNPIKRKIGILNLDRILKLLSSITLNLQKNLIHMDQIVQGKLDNDIEIVSENDNISIKLIELKAGLKKDKEELEKTKIAEKQQNWISSGLAMFGDVLRQDSQEIKKVGYDIITHLVDYVNFNQGALYVLNDASESDPFYELTAAVAYDRKKLINKDIRVGEGLVGRCAYEKKTIYLTDIPQNYLNITSGLGTANPNNLLLVPCILDDKVYSIIEVASFTEIKKHEIKFIEKLGESIASSIYNVKNTEKTNDLLRASQNQSEELTAQEEELRQNLEEMETTQEELRRQMALNAKMQEKMNFEKYLFDTLLENIPARVNFKDKDRKYIRASKSFLERFGKNSNDEIIGKTDFDFFEAEFAKQTMTDEIQIINSKQGRINFIEHEVKDGGEEIWKNVTKIPLINKENNCIGVFASVYDITDYKMAEFENGQLKKELEQLKNNLTNA